jgi:hypothetical protein
LFFAELMLVPELQLSKDAEPMRVLHVSTIDDVPCYGMLYIQVCLYMYFGILCRSVNKLPFFLIEYNICINYKSVNLVIMIKLCYSICRWMS